MKPHRARSGWIINWDGFTLIEILVSMTVLGLLLVLFGQMFRSALAVTTLDTKGMDCEGEARAIFDRMQIDFSRMIRRSDVDYFLKDTVNLQRGNDQLAFYSEVPGYFSTASNKSPLSLVAYRVNSDASNPAYNQMERFGYGLVWNGVATNPSGPAQKGIVFSAAPTSSLPNTISLGWPNATTSQSDPTYEEVVGPDVFRLEYYYTIRGRTVPAGSLSTQLSAVPWDTRSIAASTAHSAIAGLQDVAAITVVLALIDPRGHLVVSNTQLGSLAGQMNDFSASMNPGDLEAQWESAALAATGATQGRPSWHSDLSTRFYYVWRLTRLVPTLHCVPPLLVPTAQRGVALVAVLLLIMLLSIMIVAYLVRSTANRQLSKSSFSQSQVDALAQSAGGHCGE